jgi:glycerol-3-phosphate acyltransferase PlsY
MDLLLIIAGFVMAYLLGSLPTSVWLGEAFFGIDVRDYGAVMPEPPIRSGCWAAAPAAL